MAHYEYDAWGNVLSVTDQNGNAITSATHIGNLNPFLYRGYYLDTETGLYYLMSRYYDPVTHRFINADGYFQSGENILDTNMFVYCANNPILRIDAYGDMYDQFGGFGDGGCAVPINYGGGFVGPEIHGSYPEFYQHLHPTRNHTGYKSIHIWYYQ